MFSQVSVDNRPHGYWFTARPCYGAVGMHPTGMLSCNSIQLLALRYFFLERRYVVTCSLSNE